MNSIYDDVDFDIESYVNQFKMAPELWRVFDINDMPDVDFSKWNSIKLISPEGDRFTDEIEVVPKNVGGIYAYCIQPEIIPTCGSYIMYIGMTAKQSLNALIKQYQKEIGDNYERNKIHRLFKKWGKYVYVHFLPVDASDVTIEVLEERLIAALLPPCNPKITVKSIKRAVNAF